jgi:hypothetical protein
METKHTPGPWKIDPLSYGPSGKWNPCNRKNIRIFAPDASGTGFIMTECVGPENIPQEQHANARLIAAAPELLEALEAGRDTVKALLAAIYAGKTENLTGAEWLEFQRKAEAAISKARGER